MKGKNKIIVLIAGFILALLLCYRLAISRTITLKQEYQSLRNQEILFKNTHAQMTLLKQKQHYYDSLLSKYHRNDGPLQNNLLKVINSFADSTNLKVVDFAEPHVVQTDDLKINSFRFSLEGDFNAIIQLIHQLEQKTKFDEVINVHFEKKKNFKTGYYYLRTNVLLKSFR